MRAPAWWCVVAALAWAPAAAADGPTAHLDYRAAEGCPAQDAFWQAFAARAQHTTRAADGAWALDVRIARVATGYDGTVTVTHDADTTTRAVRDPSCANVATALAVIAAITVEPAMPPPPSPPPPPPPPPPPSPPPPPPPPPRVRWRWRAGIDAASTTYLAPSLSLDGEAFAELARESEGGLGFRVRAVFHYATSGTVDAGGVSAVLTSYLGRLEVGGVQARFARTFALHLLAAVEAGAMVGEGRSGTSPETHAAPWVDLGVMARLAWEPSPVFVEVALGAFVPVLTPRFVFQPDVVIFEADPVGALGELGLGVRF